MIKDFGKAKGGVQKKEEGEVAVGGKSQVGKKKKAHQEAMKSKGQRRLSKRGHLSRKSEVFGKKNGRSTIWKKQKTITGSKRRGRRKCWRSEKRFEETEGKKGKKQWRGLGIEKRSLWENGEGRSSQDNERQGGVVRARKDKMGVEDNNLLW